MSAGGKLRGHHWVHADHDLFLFGHDGIALFDLLGDPLLEILSDHCNTDIDNPLLRDLGQVWLVRQVVFDVRLPCDELHHALHRQVLILGHVYMFDGIVLDICFLPAQDVF